MSDSLRDQLLKAGLVDEKKLRHLRQGGKKGRGGGKARPETGNTRTPAVHEARAQQAERSRDLNRKREEAAQRKALAAQIRQIILDHRLAREDADQVYHFQHGDRIRSIHVTAEQRDGLVRGQLGVVTLGGGYELLAPDALGKVRERDAARVIVFNGPDDGAATRTDTDDAYAEYRIPDDLMW
jgi:uncharacterized protein